MFNKYFETDAYKDCAPDSLYVEFDAFTKCNAKYAAHERKQKTNHGNNS